MFSPLKGWLYQTNKFNPKNFGPRAKLKPSAGRIWPAGRMFCMPGLGHAVDCPHLMPRQC